MPAPILRSECGRYYAARMPDGNDRWHWLFDADGRFVGRSSYWGNRSTETRVGFEVGVGDLTVRFGYPRHPSWFRRRWIEIDGDIWIGDVEAAIRSHGGEPLDTWKPDINIYIHAGFRATPEQLREIDREMRSRGWRFEPRAPRVDRGITCPGHARTWPKYRVNLQWPSEAMTT